MKKYFLSLAALLFAQLGVDAQTVIKNNYDSPISTVDGSQPAESSNSNCFVQGSDIGITFNTDAKVYGVKLLYDVSDLIYTGVGFLLGTGDYSSYSTNFYLGVGKRYLIGKSILLQGKIGGYAGYYSYEQAEYDYGKNKTTKKDKSEFMYGAEANISAGLKLWTSKKGTSGFITVGYYMSAPKFKTDNMGDNGSWGIGITLVK